MALRSVGSNPSLAVMLKQYWIPLCSSLSLPLPITAPIKIKNGKLNFNNYNLATDKIFSTPKFSYAESDNTKGICIVMGGRLKGISKAKKFKTSFFAVQTQKINNNIDYYKRPIFTKWGTIGLKVTLSSGGIGSVMKW